MKKIIKRVILGIVAVIIIAIAGLAAYLFIPRTDVDIKPTTVDASGNVYSVYKDEEKKESYAVVTDADGKIWGAEIKDDGSVGDTKVNLENKVSKEDVITKYTGPDINITNNVGQYTGAVSEVVSGDAAATTKVPANDTPSQNAKPSGENGTTAANNTAANSTAAQNNSSSTTTSKASNGQAPANNTTKPAGTTSGKNNTPAANTTQTTAANNVQPNDLKISKYKEIFASNNYLIEFTTNDNSLDGTPIVAAAKNGNLIFDTSIDGTKCKMLYLASKDKTYLLLDTYRMYCAVPESVVGDDFNFSEMNMGSGLASNIDINKIKKSTVTIDGVNYYCESCDTKDGGEVKFYFDGDSLVRFDSVSVKDGVVSTTSTFFSKITTEVPDDLFEIPKNYKYLNISWLDALGGNSKK